MQTDGKGDNPHAWLFSGPLRSHHGCQADHTKRLSYQYQFVHMPLPTRFFPCSNNPRSNAFALKGVCDRSKCTVVEKSPPTPLWGGGGGGGGGIIMTNQVRTKSQQKLQVGAFHTTVEKSPPPPHLFFFLKKSTGRCLQHHSGGNTIVVNLHSEFQSSSETSPYEASHTNIL